MSSAREPLEDETGVPVEDVTFPRFSYAFQPIVDVSSGAVSAYEALIRGPNGEPAPTVFAGVRPSDLHSFDRASRLVALTLANTLGASCDLNLNVLPLGLEEVDRGGRALMDHLRELQVPPERIVLEVTEGEIISDYAAFGLVINEYRRLGIKVAIDDFGAGYSGLNLLAEFQPDALKLDMNLVRHIDVNGPRQAIVRGIMQVCDDLGIDVIAEGVESDDERAWFERAGVRLFQGFLFAAPGFEALPDPTYSLPVPSQHG